MRALALNSMPSSSSWVPVVRRSIATSALPTIAPPITSGAQALLTIAAARALNNKRQFWIFFSFMAFPFS